MRIIALNPFQVTNFQYPPRSPGRYIIFQAGTYDLVAIAHPDPALQSKLLMFFVSGYPQIGACQKWWENEIEAGRMGRVITDGENPRVMAEKDFFR